HELCRGWQHFSHVRARADWARTPQQARAKVADDMTRAESFSVGDSVGPVLYLPDGRLFVGYMDQAIFGDDPPGHPARSGLAGLAIDDRHLLSGIVDEDLVAGGVFLAHRRRQALLETAKQFAEAAIAVTVGMD